VAALRHRVQIAEDPAMTAVAPRLRPARVTVTLKDGRQDTQSLESHRGDFMRPFDEAELRGKFRELAGEVLTTEGVREVERAVNRCEEWKSVRELIDLMRRHGRAS
jgi:2-methylcitrate dehydratase PrpD